MRQCHHTCRDIALSRGRVCDFLIILCITPHLQSPAILGHSATGVFLVFFGNDVVQVKTRHIRASQPFTTPRPQAPHNSHTTIHHTTSTTAAHRTKQLKDGSGTLSLNILPHSACAAGQGTGQGGCGQPLCGGAQVPARPVQRGELSGVSSGVAAAAVAISYDLGILWLGRRMPPCRSHLTRLLYQLCRPSALWLHVWPLQ